MAKIVGQIQDRAPRGWISVLTGRLSPAARLRAEASAGEGLRRLLPLLESLPEAVTAVLHPSLGFMAADCCVVGPTGVLVVQTVHWTGPIRTGEKGEWLAGGRDLGRPDRQAAVFADRLRFTEYAAGLPVQPAVIFTAGEVQRPEGAEAVLVPWDQAGRFLREQFPDGLTGQAPPELIQVLAAR